MGGGAAGWIAGFIVDSSISATMWARRATHGRMEEKLMPDFDTRKPQGSNEPNRPPMTLLANRLSRLLSASKGRILSMAGMLRHSLLANKLRSLLIGGVLIFVIAPALVGMFIYSFWGFSPPQQEARELDPRCWGNLARSTENSNPGDDSNDTQIAFTRTTAGDAIESELYVMDADGTNETQLTNTSAVGVTSPVWSPDGKKMVYLRSIDLDRGRTDGDIYVINADGTNQSSITAVAEPYTTTIAWSPDGQKIAFFGLTPGDLSGTPGFHLINPDGTGLEYLTGSGSFTWSPDSNKIAFALLTSTSVSSASASDEDSDLYVRRTDGSDLTRLTNTPDTDESSPVWSPDGTKIAFSITDDVSFDTDIYVMNADGSGQDYLTDGSYPVWSPDSKKIAFIRGSGIYVMNADGNCERHLTNYNDSTVGITDVLDWSPDGEKIAFKSASSGNNDIYVINADGSGRTNLTNSKQSEDYFAWSPARVDASTERTEKAVEDQQPIDSAPQEEALQAYIEQINELLAEKDLRGSEEGSEVRRLAREKTLQVLEGSDPSTKEKVVRFLADADLVQDVGQRVPIISLSNIDLESANLSGIDLRGADFRAADLGSSDLQEADLSGANLTGANLTNANLTDVQLQRANMTNATLHATDLNRADLTGANLTGVYMTAAEQRQAEQSATGVYLPEENKAKVRAWEAAARGQLKDLYASLERCLTTIPRVEDWGPKDSPEEIRDSKILRCTNSADSDSFFKYYEDDLRPNVGWKMIQQTELVGNVRENTGEVLIQVAHEQGGSGFQTSTATNGRIERIPRWF